MKGTDWGKPLGYAAVRRNDPALVSAAEAYFGSWGNALHGAGLDPNLYLRRKWRERTMPAKRDRLSYGNVFSSFRAHGVRVTLALCFVNRGATCQCVLSTGIALNAAIDWLGSSSRATRLLGISYERADMLDPQKHLTRSNAQTHA